MPTYHRQNMKHLIIKNTELEYAVETKNYLNRTIYIIYIIPIHNKYYDV